ncbi:hypothetical protein B0H16DRAFT_47714 [Mycena metata]|uniref:Uncharacterized protein n=1 Tax=Mycena metata TaxID=1033252 RepID=A0AAD7K2G1_9AGAR|nr:hypothetical protein B0H16DRAFT_47714 [Mycena metata]
MLRTVALWERKRAVRISLMILAVLTGVPMVVFTELELESLKYVQTDDVGCKLAHASSIVIFAYLMLLISETVIVVLTAVKAYHHLRRSRQPWLVQLYKDGKLLPLPEFGPCSGIQPGMLFYVFLLGISVANILVPILAPVSVDFVAEFSLMINSRYLYANWLASPQRVLHSVLCTRVLLLIRGSAARPSLQEVQLVRYG